MAPGGDNRTVVRGGYGIYHARILGQVFNSLTGIHTSDNVTFQNTFDGGHGPTPSSGRTRMRVIRRAA